ncbi:MAG: ADP-glyceromanno-heptose 6-epimerase [Saprospiraceae bacterium]
MIIVTGAAGFIGSVLVCELNFRGYEDLILVDQFGRDDRSSNLEGKKYTACVERDALPAYLQELDTKPTAIFHIGARTDTAEMDVELFEELNLKPSKVLWEYCTTHQVPFIYASSAATFGGGEHGYSDAHDVVDQLKPLNPYGDSKQLFDQWVLGQNETPPFWAGLKFFNVYGPNEYHKGRMASVIFHAYNQITATGKMKLFRSHREDVANGQQSRDFIFVADLVDMLLWLNEHQPTSGLYNIGTGKARSFHDLVVNVFKALDKEPDISFIDTPIDIRATYQYFTEADMSKLRKAGYDKPFTTLEEGVDLYVKRFLIDSLRA